MGVISLKSSSHQLPALSSMSSSTSIRPKQRAAVVVVVLVDVPIFIRPAGVSPILISKNTTGLVTPAGASREVDAIVRCLSSRWVSMNASAEVDKSIQGASTREHFSSTIPPPSVLTVNSSPVLITEQRV